MTADDLPQVLATLPAAWRAVLPGWTTAQRAQVVERVRGLSGTRPIGPADPLRALRVVAPDDARVVLFGQDPYPTPGHADGLAFSAGRGRPRSLARVFEALAADRPGWVAPAQWALDGWAAQGVLLLNPVLTVELGRPDSHAEVGWQVLTSAVVMHLVNRADPPVFMLWGARAQRFFASACPPGRAPRVLTTRHPSYDFQRRFMAEGSHFVATADRVDWWAL